MDFDQRTESIGWMQVLTDVTLDPKGRDVLVVVAKMAFAVGLDGKTKVVPADVRRVAEADPGGGVHRPADLEADWKPGTDVGLVGTAHVQRVSGAPPRTALAWLRAGTVHKAVKIHGPRVFAARWGDPVLSDPAPIQGPVPLRWDLAWGGRDEQSGAYDPFNPIGRGFTSTPSRLDGELGPQLEPMPEAPQAGVTAVPPHRSHGAFAPIPPPWEPRRARIGTHDAAWVLDRAPVRPRDFDPMHFSWAVPGLHSAAPLRSDVPIEVGGVLEQGIWRFALPRYEVRFESELGGERRPHDAHLDGYLVDADTRQVELTWRTRIALPRKWELLEKIVVTGHGDLPEDAPRVPSRAA